MVTQDRPVRVSMKPLVLAGLLRRRRQPQVGVEPYPKSEDNCGQRVRKNLNATPFVRISVLI
jgi:hypothetical protein